MKLVGRAGSNTGPRSAAACRAPPRSPGRQRPATARQRQVLQSDADLFADFTGSAVARDHIVRGHALPAAVVAKQLSLTPVSDCASPTNSVPNSTFTLA